jgi:hypothetical protein
MEILKNLSLSFNDKSINLLASFLVILRKPYLSDISIIKSKACSLESATVPSKSKITYFIRVIPPF